MRVRRQQGFTLIELLVVLAILAMLAAVVVPRVFRSLEKAKVNTAKTQIAAFETAIAAYRLDVGSFPTTDQGLQALRTEPSGVENWDGPYLPKDVPADPWGHPYVYKNMAPTLQKRNDTSRIAGHTLLELLVVLALLLAVASLVAPVTVRAYANLKLRLAAGAMAKAFQQAKSRALFEGHTFVVIFPSAKGRERLLVIARDDGRYVNQFVLPSDVLLTGRRGKGDWTDEIDPLPFYPDGTSEAAELNLNNASRLPLCLAVDPMTAKVRMVPIDKDEQ